MKTFTKGTEFPSQEIIPGNSLALSLPWGQVQSLIEELTSHKPCGTGGKEEGREEEFLVCCSGISMGVLTDLCSEPCSPTH